MTGYPFHMFGRSLAAWLGAAAVAAGLAFAAVPSASAQSSDRASPSAKDRDAQARRPAASPERHPRPKPRVHDLDFLFGALKAAPDAQSAKIVENRILAQWVVSGSDTTDILMSRVKTAVEAKELDLATTLLDSIVELQPDYVEGWNRRATVRFMRQDLGGALADIRQVLAREPRHFAALAGLGMILQEVGEEKWALEAFRRALEVHPHLPRIGEMVKSLTEKVEGRDI